MYTNAYIFYIYFTYKICLLIKFAPNTSLLSRTNFTFKDTFLSSKTHSYYQKPLPVLNCRPWTSLNSTIFTPLVFPYNYEN
nr:MAG TPA: hypothetical protein [Caudoviricetes sp.]